MASKLSFITLIIFSQLACGCDNDVTQKTWSDTPTINLSDQVDLINLQADVDWLADDARLGRKAGTPAADEVAAWLSSRFSLLGLKPFAAIGLEDLLHDFPIRYRIRPKQSTYRAKNIIGLIEGSEFPEQYIIVSAHYDHLGVINGSIFNGADDNASGVAALLEIARILTSNAQLPHKSIVFVTFSAEELGRQGAKSFCGLLSGHDLTSQIINLNIEMFGAIKSQDSYMNVWDNGLVDSLITALQHAAKKVEFPLLITQGNSPPSDASELTNCGVVATTIDVGGGKRFKQHHPHYHKASDLPEHIDYQGFQKAVQLALEATWELANK